jgi:hypothetical protein
MMSISFVRSRIVLLAIVALAVQSDPLFPQAKNPKGLTPEQVAGIHGRVFRTEEAGAIPTALAKGSGDVYIHAPTATITEVALDPRNQIANWMRYCDLVAVGRIGTGASYMTAGKGFLNTDWSFVVEEVLKDNPLASVNSGESITVIRSGGKLNIGGRTVHAVQRFYKEFRSGNQYLLFLKFVPETGAYSTHWPMGFAFSGVRIVRLTVQPLHPEIEAMDKHALLSLVKEISAAPSD